MKPEKSLLSSFTPKKPSDELKQRVLNAATGVVQEPYTYEPFFGKLDWGLLAASLLLAAALFTMNGGGGDSPEKGGTPSNRADAAERAMFEELEIPVPGSSPCRHRTTGTEELLREIGG